MMEEVLRALIITFLALFTAGFIVFSVFFIIYKVYFKKQWKLMERYNRLSSSMYSVNFFKIEVLHKNGLIAPEKYQKIKNQYETIDENLKVIYDNLMTLTKEINMMNLEPAKYHLGFIAKQLDSADKDFGSFGGEYDKYTAYPDELNNIFQTYLDIFESLNEFYNTRVLYHEDFKKINKLFDTIAKEIKSIPEFSSKFNYKLTINVLIDLHNRIEALVKVLFVVLKFQIVQIYLRTSMTKNNQIINANYKSIAHTDLPILQKSINIYKTSYLGFVKSFKALDLNNAQRQLLTATKALINVNQFCYIHSKTRDLINISLQDIDEQTKDILNNKEHIVASLSAISANFVKDSNVKSWFKTVSKDLIRIEKLVNESQLIDYKTHSQKIKALEDLANISGEIIEKKDEINDCINGINKHLGQLIATINDLNDLYIYLCQLSAVANQILPNNQERALLKQAMKENINVINALINLIITDQQPDFDKITSSTNSIINNVNQIYTKINNDTILKSYASKLLVYANRYRSKKDFKKAFSEIDDAFKSSHYAQCIDALLIVINKNKNK